MCEAGCHHAAEEWKKNFDGARSFMLDVAAPAGTRRPAAIRRSRTRGHQDLPPAMPTIKILAGSAARAQNHLHGKN
jgi:hypothetical protein